MTVKVPELDTSGTIENQIFDLSDQAADADRAISFAETQISDVRKNSNEIFGKIEGLKREKERV